MRKKDRKSGHRRLLLYTLMFCLAAVSVLLFAAERNGVSVRKIGGAVERAAGYVISQKRQSAAELPDFGTLRQSDRTRLADRYNTGAASPVNGRTTQLQKLELIGEKFVSAPGGAVLRYSENVLTLNLERDPISIGTVLENVDFAGSVLSSGAVTRVNAVYPADDKTEGTITFVNCRIPYLTLHNKQRTGIRWVFIDCTFLGGVAVSNATFYRCQFGSDQTSADVQCDWDTAFYDCYFWYANDYIGGSGSHADGVQVSGIQDDVAGNILIDHCNFAILAMPVGTNSDAPKQDKVNACIMIQPDYGPIDGVEVRDCTMNGGGYTVYLNPKSYPIHNAVVSGAEYGCSRLYDVLYPTCPEEYVWERVSPVEQLKIGSIWKDADGVHLAVTNYTAQPHTLRVVTEDGQEKTFEIPACPTYPELDAGVHFADLPFDLLVTVGSADTAEITCYDGEQMIAAQAFT